MKTTRAMTGEYAFMLKDRAAAQEFVQRPDVWWYVFPADEDWAWRRGGAWNPAPGNAEDSVPETAPEPEAPAPGGDGEDDGRW